MSGKAAVAKAALIAAYTRGFAAATAQARQTNALLAQIAEGKVRATAKGRANITKRLSSLRRKMQAHRNRQEERRREIARRIATLRVARRNRRSGATRKNRY